MKKILVVLSLFFCLGLNAQIQRFFFEMELGVSTQQQVENKLREMGKPVIKKADEIRTNNIKFGEYNWEQVSFGFKENKLILIAFKSRTYTSREEGKIALDASVFSKILENKYKEYSFLDKTNYRIYADKETMVLFLKNSKMFSLAYADGEEIMNIYSKLQNEL